MPAVYTVGHLNVSGEIEGLNTDTHDRELAAAAAAGDPDAFAALVDRHQASVYRLARLLVHSQADAEDLLQQTFLSAWRSLASYRGEASVRTWLLTITRHAAFARRAREARLPIDETRVEDIEDLGVAAGWGRDPEQLALRAEQHEVLRAAFGRLSPEEREVLTLRDLEGLSGDDTAALLGVTRAAMKSRLHRARMALAAEVQRAQGAGGSHNATA